MNGLLAAQLPKAVLHDHLDGGLRINTLLELADENGYNALPATNASELAAAMYQAESGSLEAYLAVFTHTVGVMRTAAAVERVAYESAIDHHLAGVAYAEIRFGPALLAAGEFRQEDAIEAALSGFRRASEETSIEVATIISALRHRSDSVAVAAAATRFAGDGVVGFDLAGPEAGYPASGHLAAIDLAREAGLNITLHAGEGSGLDSIADALACGAQRLGHGVRVIEDCRVESNTIVDVGELAQRVLDDRVPLEVAISSNLHTGIAATAADHPFGMLYRAGFNVSINTDNRLMSHIDMTEEFTLAAEAFDLTVRDLAAITDRTIAASFADEQRRTVLRKRVADRYATAIAEL